MPLPRGSDHLFGWEPLSVLTKRWGVGEGTTVVISSFGNLQAQPSPTAVRSFALKLHHLEKIREGGAGGIWGGEVLGSLADNFFFQSPGQGHMQG